MPKKGQVSSEEYYKDYLAQTSSSTSNSKDNKSSLVRNTTLLLALVALPAGLYYVWEQKDATSKVVPESHIVNKVNTKPMLSSNPSVDMSQKVKQVTVKNKAIEEEQIQKTKLASIEKEKQAKVAKEKAIETQRKAKAEKIRLAKIKADTLAKKKELEVQRLAKIKVKQETLAKKEAEAKRTRLAKIEADRKEKIAQDKLTREKLAKEKLEKEKLAKEKNIAKAKAEKVRLAKLEADKKMQLVQNDIQKLEQALLSGLIESEAPTSTKNSKKIDTFNKIVVNKKSIIKENTNTNFSQVEQELTSIMNTSNKNKNNYTKALKKEAKVREDEMQYVLVKEGDTLFYIAKRIYGDAMLYPVIFDANPDILNDPARISIGQKLRVPKIKGIN